MGVQRRSGTCSSAPFPRRVSPMAGRWVKEYKTDESVYGGEQGVVPGEVVSVERAGTVRGVPVARVTFRPFQWDPGTKELLSYSRISARVVFEQALSGGSSTPSTSSDSAAHRDAFTGTLAGGIVNYRPVSRREEASEASTTTAIAESASTTQPGENLGQKERHLPRDLQRPQEGGSLRRGHDPGHVQAPQQRNGNGRQGRDGGEEVRVGGLYRVLRGGSGRDFLRYKRVLALLGRRRRETDDRPGRIFDDLGSAPNLFHQYRPRGRKPPGLGTHTRRARFGLLVLGKNHRPFHQCAHLHALIGEEFLRGPEPSRCASEDEPPPHRIRTTTPGFSSTAQPSAMRPGTETTSTLRP